MNGLAERLARAVTGRGPGPRPKIRTAGKQSGTPTVYLLAPDYALPSGGIWVMYRQVDILNAAGVRASVLHQRPGFRCDWFENSTTVTDVVTTPVGPDDVVVVPEIDVDVVAGLASPVRHIVLNQSGHLTWKQGPDAVAAHYRSAAGLLGMITVSEHSTELISYALPELRVRRVRPGIDPAVFGPGAGPRPPRLSYLARRGADDATLVLRMLEARGVLGGWQIVRIGGTSQGAFAHSMQGGRIVLSLSYQEGFGLPAAEAMACGNYVVGYTGFGGREFFREEFSGPVPTGDVLAVARAVEEAVRRDAETSTWTTRKGRQAAEFVLDTYSLKRERDDALAAYSDLLSPLKTFQPRQGAL